MIILISTIFFRLILFKQLRPFLLICLARLFTAGQIRKDLYHCHERGQHNKVDKSDLTFCHICDDTIVQWVNLKLVHLLEVTLGEELDEEQVTPKPAQLPVLRWVRDVSQMEHKLNE